MESERMLLTELLTPTPFLRSIQSAAPALRSIRVGSAYPQAIRQQLNQSRSQSARARSYIKLNASDRHATQKKDTQAAPSATNRSCNCKNRSEEHTSELQSQSNLVCRLLLEKKKNRNHGEIYS